MRPLTDKQKSRLWEQTRNSNFQAKMCIRDSYHRFRNDEAFLNQVMKDGAEKASARASQTLKAVYEEMCIRDRG